MFLKLYSVKSGNTCLSVANSEGKTNGYCAKPRAFRQAAIKTSDFQSFVVRMMKSPSAAMLAASKPARPVSGSIVTTTARAFFR